MFGYIIPLKTELKVREYEVYSAYYCAICRSIKKRYGELPRLMLSFDSVFLALLSASISQVEDKFEVFRCFTNPAKKRNEVVATPHIDYAADMLVLLGYYSLKDDKEDDNSLVGNIGELVYRKKGRKISELYPEKVERIVGLLKRQSEIEKEKCPSIDKAADSFGILMSEVMDFPKDLIDIADDEDDYSVKRKALKTLGYHLGRYIYIIDAIDDFEKDKEKNNYNPLIYSEGVKPNELDFALHLDLNQMAEVLNVLDLQMYKGILENIIYLGMSSVKDEVLFPKSSEESKRKRRRYLKP